LAIVVILGIARYNAFSPVSIESRHGWKLNVLRYGIYPIKTGFRYFNQSVALIGNCAKQQKDSLGSVGTALLNLLLKLLG
jgi:hypothetical protein